MSDVVGRIETVKLEAYREICGLEFETVLVYNTLKPFHPFVRLFVRGLYCRLASIPLSFPESRSSKA